MANQYPANWTLDDVNADIERRLQTGELQYPRLNRNDGRERDPAYVATVGDMIAAEQARPRNLNYSRESGLRSVASGGSDGPQVAPEPAVPPAEVQQYANEEPTAARPAGMSVQSIRDQYPRATRGKSDLEIINDIAQANGVSFARAAVELGVPLKDVPSINAPGFVTSLKQGLGSNVYGIGRLAADAGWEGNPLQRYGEEVMFTNPSSEASQSLEGFLRDPAQGVAEFAGGAIGSTAPSFLLGGAGMAGRVAGLRGLAAMNSFPVQAGVAAVPSYGHNRMEQDRTGQGGVVEAGLAALGQGAVEMGFGPQRALGLGRGAAATGWEAAAREFGKSPLRTFVKSWGRQGLEEAGEELVQQPMQQLSAYQDPLSEESLRDTGWSAFGGLVGGLAMGPAGAARHGMSHQSLVTRTGLESNTPVNLLLNRSNELDRMDEVNADQAWTRGVSQQNDARIAEIEAADLDAATKQAEFAKQYGIGTPKAPLSWQGPVNESGAGVPAATGNLGYPGAAQGPAPLTAQNYGIGTRKAPVAWQGPVNEAGVGVGQASGNLGYPTNAPRMSQAEARMNANASSEGNILPPTPEENLRRKANAAQAAKAALPALQEEAQPQPGVPAKVAAAQEKLAVVTKAVASLGKRQKEYWGHRLGMSAMEEGAADTEIAKVMGVTKQRVNQYKNASKARLEKLTGMTTDEIRALLIDAAVRETEEADVEKLGLSPAEQPSRGLGSEEVFGDGENTGQQMSIVDSAGKTTENQFEDVTGNREGAEGTELLQKAGALTGRGWTEPSNYQTAKEVAAEELAAKNREAHAADERSKAQQVQLEDKRTILERFQQANQLAQQVDIDDAAEDYDADLQEGDIPFHSLPAEYQLQYAKAYWAYNEKGINAQTLARIFSEIADANRTEIGQERAVQEGPAVEELPVGVQGKDAVAAEQPAALPAPVEPVAEAQANTERQGDSETVEGQWDEVAGQHDLPTWNGLDAGMQRRLSRAFATKDDDTIISEVLRTVRDLKSLEEDQDEAAGYRIGAGLEASWQAQELTAGAMAGLNRMLDSLAKHPVIGAAVKAVKGITFVNGGASQMTYRMSTGGINIPTGWVTEKNYDTGPYAHLREQVFIHEVGHSIDKAGAGDKYSSRPAFKVDAVLTKDGLTVRPRGVLAADLHRAYVKLPEGHYMKAMLGYFFEADKELSKDLRRKYAAELERGPLTVSEQVQREMFAQLVAIFNLGYNWKTLDNKTLRESLKEVAPVAHSLFGAVNVEIAKETPAQSTAPRYSGSAANAARDLELIPGVAPREAFLNDPSPRTFFGALSDLLTDPRGALKKHGLGWLTLEQMADVVKSKAVEAYKDAMVAMQQTSKAWVYRASTIDQDWMNISADVQKRLSTVMRSATREGFDPDKDAPSSAAHQEIKAQWAALPNSAKEVYRKVRDYYAEAFEERKAIMMDAANKAKLAGKNVDEVQQLFAQVKGPYFPLMRMGKWYSVGMSPEMSALQAKKEDGTLTEAESRRYESLRKDKKHYAVSGHESRREAKNTAKRYEQELGVGYHNAVRERTMENFNELPNLNVVEQYIAADLPADARAEVKSMVAQMYFDMLPEGHALKRQMKREGVEGEEEDMRRVFAASALSQAHYISRLKHANDLSAAMQQVRNDARVSHNETKRMVENELTKRTKLAMNHEENPIVDRILQTSYFAHLGLSPAFVLTNMTQVPMITVPWLGARHGFGSAGRAVAAAYADVVKLMKSSYGETGLLSELDWNGKVTADEAALLSELTNRNLLDITMEHDLGAVADMRNSKMDKYIKLANAPVRITELANRAVTSLAAYRLARASGMDHEGAVNHAAKAVSETQLNYSGLNTARHMQSVLGSKTLARVVFQFRKYQQGMIYLIAKNVSDAVRGQDRAVALRTLLGLFTSTGLMAGALGMPFFGALTTVASIVGGFGGDDDEPFDAEVELRNWLADVFGEDVARAMAKGLPTLVNVDLSKRVGMGDLGSPLPFVRQGKTGTETVNNTIAAAVGGAAGGTLADILDGLQLMADGQVEKGAEKVVPLKAAANLLRAHRYASEGLSNRKGETVLPDERFSPWDLAMRAAGFQPTKESEYYEANNAVESAKQATTDTRSKLLRDYAQAKMRGEDVTDVEDSIREFNTRHPEKGVKIDASSKLKAVQSRRKMSSERLESGVKADRTSKAYVDRGRFAGA